MLQTEFEFTLPQGLMDRQGQAHRQGLMRLATAMDEAEILADPRAQGNEMYFDILLLSRVVVRLGDYSPLTPALVGSLFSKDFSFLQDLYAQINQSGSSLVETRCPSCQTHFAVDLSE